MNIENMKALLENKDKQSASKEKRELFAAEWLSYVRENGVDQQAEEFIIKGFEYRKMLPLAVYAGETGNYHVLVKQFLEGEKFKKVPSPKNFNMALNLLAVLLTKCPDELETITELILILPSLSMDKNRNRIKTIGKAVENFFFPELKTVDTLPDLNQLEIRLSLLNSFREMMADGLSMYASIHDAQKKNKKYDLVCSWIEIAPEKERNNTDIAMQLSMPAPAAEQKQEQETVCETAREIPAETDKPDEILVRNEQTPETRWKTGVRMIENYIVELESKYNRTQARLELETREKRRLTEENEQLKTRLSRSEASEAELTRQKLDLCDELDAKRTEIGKLQDTIVARDAEIADRKKLADMVSKDSAKQSDAVLKRLSSELSTYYSDFVSVTGEAMTVDIGEVLRDQLNDIYRILKKNGMTL